MAKVSKKKQGQEADPSAMSSANIIRDPQHLGRGLGSAYAIAVDNLHKQAEEMSGSKNGFLGVAKEHINPYENLHSSLLPKGFDPRTKASE